MTKKLQVAANKPPVIRPRDDQVLIERERVQEGKTESGLIVVDKQNKHKPQVVKVLAIGPGKISPEGKRIPIEHLTVGGTALAMPFVGNPLDDLLLALKIPAKEGCLWSLCKAEDLLANVE